MVRQAIEQHLRKWWEADDAEAPGAVSRLVDTLRDEYAGRREAMLQWVSLYEGRRLEGLYPEAYDRAGEIDELRLNIGRSAVETVTAKIAGRQRPKPQFLTSGGSFSQQRRARKLDKFVEGVLAQRQGRYVDAWDLATDVFRDAATVGVGILKPYADPQKRRVTMERVHPWDVYVDLQESRYGAPCNLFVVTVLDRSQLCATYPEHAAAIEQSSSPDPAMYGNARTGGDVVEVFEAWRLPLGDKPGRHVICTSSALLLDEEWTRERFPLAVIRWQPERLGWWATGLIEETAPICEEVNHTAQRIQESERINGNGVIFYEEGSVDEEVLAENEIGMMVPVRAGSSMPQFTAPPSYSGATLQWLELNRQAVFEISGVSYMSATSRKEAGVTAGVALRTLNDMETERFSVVARSFESMFVDLAHLIVDCVRELADDDPDFAVKWPGKRLMREIRWEDVSLEDDQYTLQVYPVSSLPSTPAGRLQTVQEMLAAQLIDQETARRLLNFADLESHMNRESAQHELVEQAIEAMLDAKPEDSAYAFPGPEPFLPSLEAAIAQVGLAYIEARSYPDTPEFNLEQLRKWINAAERLIQRAQAAAAPAGQGAGMGAGAPAPGPPGQAAIPGASLGVPQNLPPEMAAQMGM